MKKGKVFIFIKRIFPLIALTGGLLIGLIAIKMNTELRKKAAGTTVAFSLLPATSTVTVGDAVQYDLIATFTGGSATETLDYLRTQIEFNSAYLELVPANYIDTAVSGFDQIFRVDGPDVANANGKIVIELGSKAHAGPSTNTAVTVAKINFRGKAVTPGTGTQSLTFTQSASQVVNNQSAVLPFTVSSASYQVTAAIVSPTPTPTSSVALCVPTLSTPLNGTNINSPIGAISAHLGWVACPGNQTGSIWYQVQTTTELDDSGTPLWGTLLSTVTTSYRDTTIPEGLFTYWRVRSCDNSTCSAAVSAWSNYFSVGVNVVPTPTVTHTPSPTPSTGADPLVCTGFVSYYKFDETSGSTADDRVGSNDGTAGSGSSIVTGKLGNARSFDGTTNGYVSVNSTYGLGNSSVSMGAWVNLSSTSLKGAIIKTGDYFYGYGIGVGSGTWENSGNNLILLYESIRWIDTGRAIGTGWHYVAMTIDGSGVPTAYIDGVSVGSFSGSTPLSPISTNLTYIGGYSGWNSNAGGSYLPRYLNAVIDEVGIWDRALSASDISQLYNGGNGLICNSPVASPSRTPTPTSSPACIRGELGNLDCSTDGCIDTSDFELFRQGYGQVASSLNIPSNHHTPDLIQDAGGYVDTADYNIVYQNFGSCSP